MKRKNLFVAILFLLLGSLACSLTGPAPTPTEDVFSALNTAQAATLQVLQTQAASGGQATATSTIIPTLVPLFTATSVIVNPPSPYPSLTPRPQVVACDQVAFIKDVTVPDGTTISAGSSFTKTWRLQNTGSCTWNNAYRLVFASGSVMNGSSSIALPDTVTPGETVDISVSLTAPTNPGSYRGNWMLRNGAGILFGLGSGQTPFYVDIKVVSNMIIAYNFVTQYCSADWRSDAGDLGCPGNEGGKNGYVLRLDNPKSENGIVASIPGLLAVPERDDAGYLAGFYPEVNIQKGDRFRANIGCQYGASQCSVVFRLDYQIGNGLLKTFWYFAEVYDGQTYYADLDLSSLAGQAVKFVLITNTNSRYSADDLPLWLSARIERPENLVTPIPSNTPTVTQEPTEAPSYTPSPTPNPATPTDDPSIAPTSTP